MAAAPESNIVLDGYWRGGINSFLEPGLLKEGEYQWGVNVDNSGGVIKTRSGFNRIVDGYAYTNLEPRGATIFKDQDGLYVMVLAIGSVIAIVRYPFNGKIFNVGVGFLGTGPVNFCRTIRSAVSDEDGGKFILNPPIPVLIIQDGVTNPKYYTKGVVHSSDPLNNGIPIGLHMQWSGGRLWVGDENSLHASDFGDPLSFFEEGGEAGGSSLFLEDPITGLFQTPDLRSLLVATDGNMSAVQSGVYDRTQWANTPDFQKVILPGIGCVAFRSFCHQFGMTWWYSHGGLVALDQALNAFRSSKIHYRDQEMMRSKSNLRDDISGISIAALGNNLLVAAPSGDGHNAETWILNQAGAVDIDSTNASSDWSSVWTGLFPSILFTAFLYGRQRTFAFSRDPWGPYPQFSPNIWELFASSRLDKLTHSVDPVVPFDTAGKIPCLFETRLLGYSQSLKKFSYAEIDLAEIEGVVSMEVFVASRKGGYHRILSKAISAAEGSLNSNVNAKVVTTTDIWHVTDTTIHVDDTTDLLPGPSRVYVKGRRIEYTAKTPTTLTVVNGQINIDQPVGTQLTQPQYQLPNTTIINNYIPQRRTIRTTKWEINESESCPVESNYEDNIDRGFTLLIKWTGKMAITGIRMITIPWTDKTVGNCEPDELQDQSLDQAGVGILDEDILAEDTVNLYRPHRMYLRTFTPKYEQDQYLAFQSIRVISPTPLPADPTNLIINTTSTPSQVKINLSWTDNSNNETGFRIEKSLDGVNFDLLDTVAANTVNYMDVDLLPNTTYYYRVQAVSYSGGSGYTNIASVTTPDFTYPFI